jgi:hypothetical protein
MRSRIRKKMTTLKITAGIVSEVAIRELWARADELEAPECYKVYRRIEEASSTRKDGSITIEVNAAELEELYVEADYHSDRQAFCDPSADYLKSWASLKRQIEKVR